MPEPGAAAGEAAAGVVALKTRSIAAADAVAQSLAALDWLRAQGCRKFFFKYCSTFDSTDAGNIGPVAEALLEALGADITIACPAAPENRRTVYQGHLFVGDRLLSETGMRNHPLNPMTDSDLVRVLGRQSKGRVGLIAFDRVAAGPTAITERIAELHANQVRFAIADALTEQNLRDIATASAALTLLTGGSGLAIGLPDLFRAQGLLGDDAPQAMPRLNGGAAVLSGSCSEATNRQVAAMCADAPSYRLDPQALAKADGALDAALDWARAHLGDTPILIYSTAPAEQVSKVQNALGGAQASALLEQAMARLAEGLVEAGVRRLVVAGGETSGAVVSALGIGRLAIGPEIAPGVPWTFSLDRPALALALKSGNFGGPDFFHKAFEVLS